MRPDRSAVSDVAEERSEKASARDRTRILSVLAQTEEGFEVRRLQQQVQLDRIPFVVTLRELMHAGVVELVRINPVIPVGGGNIVGFVADIAKMVRVPTTIRKSARIFLTRWVPNVPNHKIAKRGFTRYVRLTKFSVAKTVYGVRNVTPDFTDPRVFYSTLAIQKRDECGSYLVVNPKEGGCIFMDAANRTKRNPK